MFYDSVLKCSTHVNLFYRIVSYRTRIVDTGPSFGIWRLWRVMSMTS